MARFLFFNSANGMLVRSAELSGEMTNEQAFSACFPGVSGIKLDAVTVVGPMSDKESADVDDGCKGGKIPCLAGGNVDFMPAKEWTPGGGL